MTVDVTWKVLILNRNRYLKARNRCYCPKHNKNKSHLIVESWCLPAKPDLVTVAAFRGQLPTTSIPAHSFWWWPIRVWDQECIRNQSKALTWFRASVWLSSSIWHWCQLDLFRYPHSWSLTCSGLGLSVYRNRDIIFRSAFDESARICSSIGAIPWSPGESSKIFRFCDINLISISSFSIS